MPNANPPIAKDVPHEISLHGTTWNDPYFWLRERDNPDVIAYLNAENEYTAAIMRPTEALQARLYAEMRGRIKETDEDVPVRRDPYLYYSRMEEGKQYPIFCRKHGSLDAPEERLLDQNALAEGHAYCDLGVYEISPDHALLAYAVDYTGSEQYTLRIKDVRTGTHLPDEIANIGNEVEWANNNRTLYYTILDETMRPYKLLRHTLGNDPASDELVFHEPDDAFYLNLAKARSNALLLIGLHSTTTNEWWFAAADDPAAQFQVVNPREHGHEYSVEHHGDRFLIRTNAAAPNFRLVEAPVATPGKAAWRELIAHRDDVLLDDVDAFRDFLAIYERQNGSKQIRITDPHANFVQMAPFPEPVYTYNPGDNPTFDSTTLRFVYTSLVTPNSVIDYDMRAGTWTVRKQDEIPSGYDPGRFQSERIYAAAPDGAQVPMSLVYKRGIARDGSNPLLLYGYGSYGYSVDPSFSALRLSLLERGFIFAIAHVRGGSELGRAWYESGKMMHKRNTFTDFIACAEHLIAEGYTAPEHLAANGRSAGGLLMGAIANLRPDLWKAIVAGVPFVDVINTMLDPSLPLTVIEWEQWGNPANKAAFEYMQSYSPYDNVQAQAYPHMLITAGLNDPRVAYWEPAKWTAKLRAAKTDNHLLLLKTNMGAGHFGVSGRYEYLKEYALEYAFLIHTLGVDPADP